MADRGASSDRSDLQRLQSIVDRHVCGELSAPLAVMHLLLATGDAEQTARAVARAHGPPAAIEALASLVSAHVEGCTTIAQMLGAGLDAWGPADDVDAGIAATRALFDDSVRRSEAASVALYSLGSEDILGRATAEVVEVLEAWGVLGPTRDALEIGCGIGRLLGPLASRLHTILGIDLSEGMVAAARRRTAGHDNVVVRTSDGRDLAELHDGAFELVLAVDSFPYIVRSGRALALTMFEEVRRVLRPGGDLVIFNFAYGDDRATCAAEVASLADAAGLRVGRSDEAPFRLWDGIGYLLRRPG